MTTAEKIFAIMICIFWLLLIIGIQLYFSLDKRRMRTERQWKKTSGTFDEWVDMTSAMIKHVIGDAQDIGALKNWIEEYRRTKKSWKKVIAFNEVARLSAQLLENDRENNATLSDLVERRRELDEDIQYYSEYYNIDAGKFNKTYDKKIINLVAKAIRMKRLEMLNAVSLAPEEPVPDEEDPKSIWTLQSKKNNQTDI